MRKIVHRKNKRQRATRRQGVSVGVVGLGIMGSAFANHLLASGHSVTGYDVAAARRRELEGRGGNAARSCADVARSARIIISSLPSPAAIAEAFFGKEGIVAGAARGTIVIEASTMPIELKERCRKRFARAGIEMLDCPISGTGAQAAAKDIAVYASGDRRAFNRCRKVFDGFSRSTYFCGDFGIGSKLKFIANLLVTIHNLSTAEAMVMAEKAGLDLGLVYRVIRDGAGTSRMLEVRGPMMVRGRYVPATMKSDVYQKDIDIIHSFARRLGCPTPLFDRSLEFYTAALRQGRAKQDTAAIHAILRKRARLRGSAPRRKTGKGK
jgi:3-hydroxyisobutyrate dehydrogenase-like beta-hydroxyacid dehydrogenase